MCDGDVFGDGQRKDRRVRSRSGSICRVCDAMGGFFGRGQ